MNIARILSHLGLTEADYNIVDNAIVMLPKTRMVDGVEEQYTPAAPSDGELDIARLELRVADLGDVMELVSKYLEGHVSNEDESINPEAFSVAHINDPSSSFWRVSLPKPSLDQLEAIKAELGPLKAARAESDAALKFLAETDYKVLRHIRQKALGQQLTLSEEEYLILEQQRSDAANKVIK